MALVEGCRHSLEITVPVEDVARETEKVVADIREKVKLPGFRPGKAPLGLIRQRFQGDVRQEVIEHLVPRFLQKQFEEENLQVVSTPDIKEIHFHEGEPLRFTAEFEVAPEFELKEVRGIPVTYKEPEVTDEDVEKRLEEIREQKAEFVNIDPRPAEEGDYVVLSMESLAGLAEPVSQEELVLHLGGEETLPAFTENLKGLAPGDEKEFDVTYPEDYGQETLAGKTVRFRATVTGLRRKELPELNDDFAKDLGDFTDMAELRDQIRKSILREREWAAQQEAKNKIIDKLVEEHEFPIPEAYLERQIRANLEQQLRQLGAQGIDIANLKLDWEKVRESQSERARKDVKAMLLLDKVADQEHIHATEEEVDREVHRFARQQREPAAALRMRLEKDGSLGRIAARIRTEKTLDFLFEHARKEAGAEQS